MFQSKSSKIVFLCLISGPKTPKFFVPDSPDMTPSRVRKSLFTADTSPVSEVSESSDEGDSMLTFAKKVTTKKFTFKKFGQKKKTCTCPQIHWPEPVVISSDEELEKSMIEVEKKVSLEMSDSD